MGKRLHLQPHLPTDELERGCWTAKEPHDRSWWQILWLLAKGHTCAECAELAETTGCPESPNALRASTALATHRTHSRYLPLHLHPRLARRPLLHYTAPA